MRMERSVIMKRRWAILAVAVMGLSGLAFQEARADYAYAVNFEVRDAGDFYEPLAPFGRWVHVDSYGWCWYPAYVDNDWRPYTTGYWLWTDGGWYWMSEEPWAWATYHYGRWVWDSYYGWLWVPGVEWAPAWVSWREGGDYIGWAPLPPTCDFGAQRTVIYAEQVVYAPNTFVFVERRHFCEPIRPSILIVNQTIVNKTVNITKIQKVNQVVINQGPRVDDIQRVTKREVPFGQIRDLRADAPSGQRRSIPAPRERPDRPRDDRMTQVRVANTPPAVAPPARALVPSQFPSSEGPGVGVVRNARENNDDRGRSDVPDRVKPFRDSPRTLVVAAPVVAPALPPVAQAGRDTARNDSGKAEKRYERDSDDDSPKNSRRN
jgi:hypothetical protein